MALLFSLALPGLKEHSNLYLFGLLLPLFFLACFIGTRPLARRQITIAQYAFWAIAMPVIIWAALLGVVFGLFFLARDLYGS